MGIKLVRSKTKEVKPNKRFLGHFHMLYFARSKD